MQEACDNGRAAGRSVLLHHATLATKVVLLSHVELKVPQCNRRGGHKLPSPWRRILELRPEEEAAEAAEA